jgi:hypothetical protein
VKIPNIKGLAGIGKAFVMANRPEILFGASVVSTVAAVVASGRAGYVSGQQVLRAEYDELDLVSPDGKTSPMTNKEKVQLTWLNYLPAAGLTAGALGSTTGLHIVHVKEKKALAAAALMAIEEIRSEANEYKDQVVEILEDPNKKPSEKVKDLKTVVENTDGEVSEKYLIRCPVTGRDIWANKAQIEEAIVEVGNCLNESSMASLNNFWEEAGWGRLPIGEQLGWNGVIPSITWHDQFGRDIAGVRDDGRPWRGFEFRPAPEEKWDDPSS